MNPCWSEFSGCETRRSDGRRKRTTHIRLSGGAVDPAHRNHLAPHQITLTAHPGDASARLDRHPNCQPLWPQPLHRPPLECCLMPRQPITDQVLAQCLKGQTLDDARIAYDSVADLLDQYEMPAEVVQSLQAARKRLRSAMACISAAQLLCEFDPDQN